MSINLFPDFKVEVNKQKTRDILIKLKPTFHKQIHINKKAKDCLLALSLIEKRSPIGHFLVVRLLGQIPDNHPAYKWLLDEISPQFKMNGYLLIEEKGSLLIVPDNPFILGLYKKMNGFFT